MGEINQDLLISRHTDELHVEHILTKIGFTVRSQVATWFAERSASRSVSGAPAR